MAVMSALLGFTSERRWLRYSDRDLAGMFPRRIGQSGYNKRIRKAFSLFIRVIRMLAMDTSLWSDDVWVVDSTPVQCGCSRETVKRSDAAGWAEYGYCASHSRYFWGLRLHLVCTLSGLPVLFALTGAKADERETLLGMLEAGGDVRAAIPGRPSSATRTTSAATSRQTSPSVSWHCCARSARARRNAPGSTCSSRCARSSNRSTGPSRDSLTWNCTAARPRRHHRPRPGPHPRAHRASGTTQTARLKRPSPTSLAPQTPIIHQRPDLISRVFAAGNGPSDTGSGGLFSCPVYPGLPRFTWLMPVVSRRFRTAC